LPLFNVCALRCALMFASRATQAEQPTMKERFFTQLFSSACCAARWCGVFESEVHTGSNVRITLTCWAEAHIKIERITLCGVFESEVHTGSNVHITLTCWAEAHIKIERITLTIKLYRNWSSFQLANRAPPLSVTDSSIAPSARMLT